jgi:pterin-4a-carbinolamine dehydratase
MPDIQTEMQKILQAWEQPETTETTEQPKESTVFKPTNNVTKATFNFIRDNAGCTRVHAIQKIVQDGHKKSSVSSLIGQMLRQGHITKNNYGMLYPNGTEYTPIKSSKTIANREKKVKTLKVKTYKVAAKGLAALVNKPIAEAFNHQPDIRTSLDVIMDSISLSDAHDLYRRLHQYFGGLPK